MNIFAAGLLTETNTFSPIPTGMDDFKVIRLDDLKSKAYELGDIVPFAQWQRKAQVRSDSFHFGLFAFAQPAGLTAKRTYENLRDEMLASLRENDSIDVVLLYLHGAMVAQDYDDCEGDLIARIREQVDSKVIIAAELDLHCHLTQTMIENANIIITYKEYPHVDIAARGDELFDIAIEASLGNIHPTMALFDCKMMGTCSTSTPEMRSFINTMVETEQKEDVLSVSFIHGFIYGDIPDAGGKVLVVTDNKLSLAQQLAENLGLRVFAFRHHIQFKTLALEEALPKALSIIEKPTNDPKKPVVIADQSDNAGGGAPSDSTFALRWMLDHKVCNAAIAIFYDPQVVKLAIAAGVGAVMQVRLGGKMGITSGDPLDLCVTISAVEKDYTHLFPQEDGKAALIPIGDTVSLHCDGIDIVVSSERSQCFSPSIFVDLGIPAKNRQLLVVKSKQHFYTAFAPIASEVIYMAGPGAVPPVVQQISYQRMSTNDKYPWIDNPFSGEKESQFADVTLE